MKIKKIFAFVLTLALVMGLIIPTTVSADSTSYDLYAGRNWLIGSVNVTNDLDNIYVEYVMDPLIVGQGWVFTEFHLAVGLAVEELPQNKKSNPEPGHFDYSSEYDWFAGVTSETFTVPIPDGAIDQGDVVIAAHAVVTDMPNKDLNGAMYGSRISNGTKGLYEIDVITGQVNLLKEITGTIADVNNGTGYTNGLAFNPVSNVLYFTAPRSVNTNVSPLWSYDIGTDALTWLCDLQGSIVSGSVYNGDYYYIAEGVNSLMKIIDPGPGAVPEMVIDGFGIAGEFTFGDIAIKSSGMLYGSTRVVPQMFFSIDMNTSSYNKYIGATALDLQLAYGSDWTLYGVKHSTGQFYSIDTITGLQTPILINDRGFADLASGTMFEPEYESAWADGERFVEKGNWATYFTYDIQAIAEKIWDLSGGFEGTRDYAGDTGYEIDITRWNYFGALSYTGTIKMDYGNDGVFDAVGSVNDLKENYPYLDWDTVPNIAAVGEMQTGENFMFLYNENKIWMAMATPDYSAVWENGTVWSPGIRDIDIHSTVVTGQFPTP